MKKPTLIRSAELADLLANSGACVLIDVRSGEDFACNRIPGAVNNCVYEVDFSKRMKSVAPDLERAVCVYGHSDETHEARMAAEKLRRAGYARVLELREGIDGWISAGHPVKSEKTPPAPAPEVHGSRDIDPAESRLEWTGRNLLNKHHGEVKISSGTLHFDHGALTDGEFTIDMRAITCTDLKGDSLHDVLINHLRDHDFFDTAIHPEARFVITEASVIPDAAPGAPNLAIRGDLTLKGVTHPLEFEAVAGYTAEGRPAAQAALSLDRTRWNVIYGSGKFFRNLAGHLVNDLIEIQVRIVTL